MSVIGLPPASVLVEARRSYLPPSDPDDPHAWDLNVQDFDDLMNLTTGLVVTWTCERCKMQIKASASVRVQHASGDRGFLRDKMARTMLMSAKNEGDKVHPRCSELKALVEVMEG